MGYVREGEISKVGFSSWLSRGRRGFFLSSGVWSFGSRRGFC